MRLLLVVVQLQMLSPVSFADVKTSRSASTAQDNLTRRRRVSAAAATNAAAANAAANAAAAPVASANEEWKPETRVAAGPDFDEAGLNLNRNLWLDTLDDDCLSSEYDEDQNDLEIVSHGKMQGFY